MARGTPVVRIVIQIPPLPPPFFYGMRRDVSENLLRGYCCILKGLLYLVPDEAVNLIKQEVIDAFVAA